ncbi:hypothetical protein AVEN_4021-1 [Araneus ventricosus]|uniref:Uncharacterized protein n=1 Tax=Araneus ventricosus TaxID=182803 RepID=A0A4Y2J716_ARAVE|nr:hypothetical protein AVEN_4021-1 [Araneus ventricosus]
MIQIGGIQKNLNSKTQFDYSNFKPWCEGTSKDLPTLGPHVEGRNETRNLPCGGKRKVGSRLTVAGPFRPICKGRGDLVAEFRKEGTQVRDPISPKFCHDHRHGVDKILQGSMSGCGLTRGMLAQLPPTSSDFGSRLRSPSLGRDGLVITSRLQDWKTPDSKKDSSEDPPCMRAWCTLNLDIKGQMSFHWC